jgi:putative CocE/NonD family hydrolase
LFKELNVKVKADFPYKIREIENTWIPLSDGTRLAARIWLPKDAEGNPVPAILEYLPYRKNDGTAIADSIRHPYFAGHGYAAVRVDIRGSGESDGVLQDEYLPQEQEDALEVIAWLAEQPWCSGRVGMMGISWGGFNSLQIAARQPPSLKAIITLCSTDDRYADDVHYLGGCVLANDMLSWATSMLSIAARPPDPDIVGENWTKLWRERLENMPHFVEPWLTHQRRDEYWKQGSVCEDYAAITCPVYAMGGWADGYTDAIFRLLEGLEAPRKGLIGPWAHNWPNAATPGPAIGFLQECLRWWDYWLKDAETGVMDEPMLRVWLQDHVTPASYYSERRGKWVAESDWPPKEGRIEKQTLYLTRDGLDARTAREEVACIDTVLGHGLESGVWCPFGIPGDLPTDQRAEDGRSLCYDSRPTEQTVEVLGFPRAELTLTVDRPVAQLVLRLCDVSPEGSSLLVSRGLLNLTHLNGHEGPEPLEPGQWYNVSIRLNALAYSLPAGHHWRVAIAPAYWPFSWPSPEPVTIRLRTGEGSRLVLPVRFPQSGDGLLAGFQEPEGSRPIKYETLEKPGTVREIKRDIISGLQTIEHRSNYGRVRLDNGLETDGSSLDVYSIIEGDPTSASVRCERSFTMARDRWRVRIEANSKMTSTHDHFHVISTLEAFEGDLRFCKREWAITIPRDLV